MEEVLQRIKEYRKKKGFSYDTMAHELKTSPAAYRKIELNQTKLTVERLFQIAQILEAKVEDILDVKAHKIYNQEVKENGIGYQDIEHFYADNKEKSEKIELLYEERLREKNEHLKEKNEIISELKVRLKKYEE